LAQERTGGYLTLRPAEALRAALAPGRGRPHPKGNVGAPHPPPRVPRSARPAVPTALASSSLPRYPGMNPWAKLLRPLRGAPETKTGGSVAMPQSVPPSGSAGCRLRRGRGRPRYRPERVAEASSPPTRPTAALAPRGMTIATGHGQLVQPCKERPSLPCRNLPPCTHPQAGACTAAGDGRATPPERVAEASSASDAANGHACAARDDHSDRARPACPAVEGTRSLACAAICPLRTPAGCRLRRGRGRPRYRPLSG